MSLTSAPAGPVVPASASTPAGPDLPDDAGLAHVIDAPADADRVVFLGVPGPDGPADVDLADLRRDVAAAAARLVGAGVGAGERVAVLGRTSYPWVVADLAVLAIGSVVVPVYPTASAEQIAHILTDSGAVLALGETAEQRAVLAERGPDLRDAPWDLGGLVAPGADVDGSDAATRARRAAVRADDLATIVYTSGTTGAPKGCMLSHRNMYVAAAGVVDRTDDVFGGTVHEPATTVLGLPLSHVFGRTVLFSCLVGGSRTALAPGVAELLGALPALAPTFLTLVPYALEKLRKSGAPTGGRLRRVICGGATLDPSTEQWFADAGVTVLQGYGLTETATAASINGPGAHKPFTVGRPIPGVTIGIAEDGEVLVRGANVTSGYWGRGPVDADGWFHTGDLGRLDDDGYLAITGRAKEILVTSGGKNVAPAPLEDRIRLHPLVADAIVLGDGRTHVTALITVDRAALAAWSVRGGHDVDPTRGGWTSHAALRAELGQGVEAANALVSRAESVRGFRVLDGSFTIAAGHLTPSLKLRRPVIENDFADDVAALYT